MRKSGRIITWKSDKGFGFIAPDGGGRQVFVHIKTLGGSGGTPRIGSSVTYVESTDAQGRPRAEMVQFISGGLTGGHATRAFVTASAFLLFVAGLVRFGQLPGLFLWLYLGLSPITFIAYAVDKTCAGADLRRTPESTLHVLALLGGWPGALFAQQYLRHKSIKQPFRTIFWFTVMLNTGALIYMMTDHGALQTKRMETRLHQLIRNLR